MDYILFDNNFPLSGITFFVLISEFSQLYETRQADVRRDCLKRWNVSKNVAYHNECYKLSVLIKLYMYVSLFCGVVL